MSFEVLDERDADLLGMCVVGAEGCILAADRAAVVALLGDRERAEIWAAIAKDASGTKLFEASSPALLAAWGVSHLWLRVRPLPFGPSPGTLVEFLRRSTPRDRVQISRDPLTGLFDRTALDRWQQAPADGADGFQSFTVLFIDLDEFKQVNDNYGHAVGDQVLRTIASRMGASLRESDLICRYGGDEFVVLLTGVSAAAEVEAVTERLRIAATAPVSVDGATFQIGASIGAATATRAGGGIEDLVARADRQMYAAKHAKST